MDKNRSAKPTEWSEADKSKRDSHLKIKVSLLLRTALINKAQKLTDN